jgi:type II secretion system protein N
MNPRLRIALKWAGYAAFYLFCLVFFSYLTFPYQRLGDRIVSDFNAAQTGPKPMRLKLGEVSSYWLSGIEAESITLTSPALPDAEGKPAKPKVLRIDSAHASLSLVRLLIGSLRINFGADAFGGEVSGFTSSSDEGRTLELELEELDLGQAPMAADVVGLPLSGKLGGNVELMLTEGKLSKADGKVSLKVQGLAAGDGKAKIRDTIALPRLEAGDLTLEADVKNGLLKLSELAANGPDLQFSADGTLRLRESLDASVAALGLTFKFLPRYTNKSDITKSLFGSGAVPGLFDLDPKMKRAKRPDGSYGFRATGVLAKLNLTPAPTSPAAPSTPAKTEAAE